MAIVINIVRTPWNYFKNIAFRNNMHTIVKQSESQFLGSTSTKKINNRNVRTDVDRKTTENHAQSTLDEADVKLFSELKNWWDPNGPMKPLLSMNLIRIPFIRDGLVQCSTEERSCTPLKDKKILDVGCGGGILSEALARIGAKVTGIDASKELINLANEHKLLDPKIANNQPMYINSTIEDHADSHTDYYDGVVASEVIEHVNNKELFVKSCVRTLKPGGRIFFTTPNRTRISQLCSIYAAEYILNIVPKGTHQYEKFVTPTELTFLLERNNCHVELSYGVWYDFLSNRWKFISMQDLMFALQAVKL